MKKSKSQANATSLSSDNDSSQELRLEKFTYKESLDALDKILDKFQSDSFSLEEMQDNYIKAKKYLEHCEFLLDKAEQQIIEIDIQKSPKDFTD